MDEPEGRINAALQVQLHLRVFRNRSKRIEWVAEEQAAGSYSFTHADRYNNNNAGLRRRSTLDEE